MTGLTTMLAGDGTGTTGGGGGGGTAPLSCWVAFSSGGLAFAVAGANGDLSAQGYGILQSGEAGGTPPYLQSLTIQGDASGKIGLADNGLGADTISYSAFALNEVENCWVRYSVTDSGGTTATARYPASGTISIQRTS